MATVLGGFWFYYLTHIHFHAKIMQIMFLRPKQARFGERSSHVYFMQQSLFKQRMPLRGKHILRE